MVFWKGMSFSCYSDVEWHGSRRETRTQVTSTQEPPKGGGATTFLKSVMTPGFSLWGTKQMRGYAVNYFSNIFSTNNAQLHTQMVVVRIRECDPRSQPLVWGSEAFENVQRSIRFFCVYCVSLYPILDAGRVRFSESPVRFTRKRTKGGV